MNQLAPRAGALHLGTRWAVEALAGGNGHLIPIDNIHT